MTGESMIPSIIIYQVGPDSLAEVYDVNHTVNCRSNTEAKGKSACSGR